MIGIYHIVNNGRKKISPFWKLNDLYLKKNKIPSTKDALCYVWLKLAKSFLRGFLNFISKYFVIIFPAHHSSKIQPRMLCAMFGWKWPIGSWEDFKFHQFRYYLPLEKDVALHLKKFESLLPKRCFVPSLVEIGSVVLEKKISKFRHCIFVIISSWKKTWPYAFEQTWIPITKGFFVPSLVR